MALDQYMVFKGDFALWHVDSVSQSVFEGKGPALGDSGPGCEMYFESEELDAAWGRIKDAGAESIHGIREMPWGQRCFRLFDPDGYVVEVERTHGPGGAPFSGPGTERGRGGGAESDARALYPGRARRTEEGRQRVSPGRQRGKDVDILMLAVKRSGGARPSSFARPWNRHTEHTARLCTLETRYTHSWEKDLHLPDLDQAGMAELEGLFRSADVLHFHMTSDENTPFGPFLPRDFMKGRMIVHHHHMGTTTSAPIPNPSGPGTASGGGAICWSPPRTF